MVIISGAYGKLRRWVKSRIADIVLSSLADVDDTNKADNKILQYKSASGKHEYVTQSGVSDHGALTGLADDDHPQYTLDAEVDAIVLAHKNIASAHHSKYTNAEAVSAVATGDDYIKNDADDESSGVIKALDFVPISPYIHFQVLDKPVLNDSGNGLVVNRTFETQLRSGAAATNYHYIYSGDEWLAAPWMLNAKIKMGTSTNNSEMWVGLLNSSLSIPTNTSIHVGFKLINGDIYATNGNGTNGIQTSLGVHLDQWGASYLAFDWNSANIKYYVDGVLKTTHTTYLPGSNAKRVFMYCKTTENVQKMIFFNEINVQNR